MSPRPADSAKLGDLCQTRDEVDACAMVWETSSNVSVYKKQRGNEESKEIRSQDFINPFHEDIVVEAQRKKNEGCGHEDDTYPPHAASSVGRRMKRRPNPLPIHQERQGETSRGVRETISTKASGGKLARF